MMEAEEEQREVFSARGAYVADSVGETRAAIGEEASERVIGNDEDADVDEAFGERIADRRICA